VARLHDDAGLQASLPLFRRYALAMLRMRTRVDQASPCGAMTRHQAKKLRSITDGSASGSIR
jgi:hypothetical protein